MHLSAQTRACSDTPDLLLSWAATRAQQEELAAEENSGSTGDGGSVPAGGAQPGQPAAGAATSGAEGGASSSAGGALAPGVQLGGPQVQPSREALDQRTRSRAQKAFLSPWELKFSALQFVRPLGSGSYGQVRGRGECGRKGRD